MSNLVFDVGLAAKLKVAFVRNGWTADLIDQACQGDRLGQFRDVLLGRAEIKIRAFELLLEPVGIVTILANAGKFVAKRDFVVDIAEAVKIHYLGDNFREWFSAKTEASIGETVLRYQKLRKGSVDGPIIAELGGEAKAETTLTELHFLLRKQGNGEAGPLLTNGRANIFYIKDAKGVLRAVYAVWHSGNGWHAYAFRVERPFEWYGGYLVFSRNS